MPLTFQVIPGIENALEILIRMRLERILARSHDSGWSLTWQRVFSRYQCTTVATYLYLSSGSQCGWTGGQVEHSQGRVTLSKRRIKPPSSIGRGLRVNKLMRECL